MPNKKYLGKLRGEMHAFDEMRRTIIKESGDALHAAKRAIFAMHREDMTEANQKLTYAKKILIKLPKGYKPSTKVTNQGSYRAALEEYIEAKLYQSFLQKKSITKISDISVDAEVYIAGLCDTVGEIARHAVKAATNKDLSTVKRCAETGELIIGELIEFNLTKYLRVKFDQAKKSVQRMEHIVYEMSIRD